VPTKDPNIEESGAVCRISAHDFHVVRSHIEAFGDLAILADVIGVVSTSLDSAVLTSAADTLHYHHQAFNAIGAFGPLFGKIAMRYAAIRTVRFPERETIISLTDLARIAHADPQLVQLLAYDMSRYEQKNSLAACSPASDNMADFGLDTAMTAEEEIDRILSSGTSMDRQIMSRVFIKIVQNLEEQINKSSHQFENHPIWLYRLRGFDESTFEVILTEWLTSLLLSHQVQLLAAALPPLVSSGCMSLTKVSEIVKRCVSKRTISNPEEALRISIAGLDLLLPSEQLSYLCQSQDAYRYRIEQHEVCQDPEGRILEAIYRMIELASTQPFSSFQTQFMGMLSSDRLLNVVRHFAVCDVRLLSTIMGIGKQTTVQTLRTHIKTLLDSLLDPTHHLRKSSQVYSFELSPLTFIADLNQRSLEQQVVLIVDSTNELSLAFCQLQIRHIFSTDVASVESISSALLQAVKIAVEKDQSSWSNLIDGLEADLTSKVRCYICSSQNGYTNMIRSESTQNARYSMRPSFSLYQLQREPNRLKKTKMLLFKSI
jgi:mediator of RNA polymerase II transcription subunit 12